MKDLLCKYKYILLSFFLIFSDLIETASIYNYTINLEGINFTNVIKEKYFLLKFILSYPAYRKYIHIEEIQKNLVESLRKGRKILSVIECYNSIDEDLLSIEYIKLAGKVLLNFLKEPKNFTYCRHPLMLCCLVSEFMIKLERKFPVYDSFFEKINEEFLKAGELFASKIKDEKALEYHLSRVDMNNRTCLQIMAQNRLYQILQINGVGNIIEKNWLGDSILHGFTDMSSFTYIIRYNLEEDIFKFYNFTRKYNKDKHFYTNINTYIDVPSIRYYFKEYYCLVLIVLYQILIYKCVIDRSLENTINYEYYALSRVIYFMSLAQAFDKLNSTIFFALVDRWHIEMDPFLLWLSFAGVILLHWFDFKSIFIKGDSEQDMKNKELIDAIFLSYQFCFLWYKIILSLKVTKTYGGFLRSIIIIFKKMFFVLIFIFCFIILMTGVFNLFFQQTLQFQNYFDAFFYLLQASQQEYELGENWNIFAKFFCIIYMGLCTFILINLVISYEASIYDSTESDISSEYKCNLVKLYEYLKWDEKYGLFKFLFAPLNVIQIPFTIFIVIFQEDNINWTRILARVLYIPVCLLYFIVYFFYQTFYLFLAIFNIIFIYPFKYTSKQRMKKSIKNSLLRILIGPFMLVGYYIRDFWDFWYYAYRDQIIFNDEFEKRKSILEFANSFESMIDIIIQKVNSKKNKIFSVQDLIDSWKLFALKQMNEKRDKNRYKHHTFLIDKKIGRRNTIAHIHKQLSLEEEFKTEHITFKNQLEKNIEFLNRFADEEGFIDKNIAKNLFSKDSYYEDDYFECIYYFRYKYFKEIMSYFDKSSNEIKKDTNKLRGVYIDFLKINEKFKILKNNLRTTEFKESQINAMAFGISNINMYFARLEEQLNSEHIREINDKLNKKNQKVKNRPNNAITKTETKEKSLKSVKIEDEK